MLKDEDINKLTTKFQLMFATKQDIKETKNNFADLKELVQNLIISINKAELARRAISALIEEEAIQEVLRAEKEPSLSGDLRELAKKFS